MRRLIAIFLLLTMLATTGSRAHLAVSPQVLDPKTPAEAWNVIRLATANVARLIEEKRLDEVALHVSLCSPALRLLARSATIPDHEKLINDNTALAFRIMNDVARASMANQQQETETYAAQLRAALDLMKAAFDPAVVSAEIYFCPLHPAMMATDRDKLCPDCNGPLRIRRLGYSDIYVKPGPPSASLTMEAKGKLIAGSPLEVTARLATPSGPPFPSVDLIKVDSAQVSMLIVDSRLDDFHVVVPKPGEKEGEWNFRFTPATSGPYRMWAEITPANTALPEFPHADLGGEFGHVNRTGAPVAESLTTTADGLTFQISFSGPTSGPPPAEQTRLLRILVTDSAGQQVMTLQPLMNAFAHVTGIYDDGQTVVRYHPTGGEILMEAARGGPWVALKTYFPKPGFVRLFCQVRVNDRIITAPFGFTIR